MLCFSRLELLSHFQTRGVRFRFSLVSTRRPLALTGTLPGAQLLLCEMTSPSSGYCNKHQGSRSLNSRCLVPFSPGGRKVRGPFSHLVQFCPVLTRQGRGSPWGLFLFSQGRRRHPRPAHPASFTPPDPRGPPPATLILRAGASAYEWGWAQLSPRPLGSLG